MPDTVKSIGLAVLFFLLRLALPLILDTIEWLVKHNDAMSQPTISLFHRFINACKAVLELAQEKRGLYPDSEIVARLKTGDTKQERHGINDSLRDND